MILKLACDFLKLSSIVWNGAFAQLYNAISLHHKFFFMEIVRRLGCCVVYFRAVLFSWERTIANVTLVPYFIWERRKIYALIQAVIWLHWGPFTFKVSRLLTCYYIWHRAFKKYTTFFLFSIVFTRYGMKNYKWQEALCSCFLSACVPLWCYNA